MNDTTKLLIAFGVVVAAGFVIVGANKGSQKASQSTTEALLARQGLMDQARIKCTETISTKLRLPVDYPTKTDSDGVGKAILTWTGNQQNYSSIVCTYVKGQGVISLQRDGTPVALN